MNQSRYGIYKPGGVRTCSECGKRTRHYQKRHWGPVCLGCACRSRFAAWTFTCECGKDHDAERLAAGQKAETAVSR